MIEFVVETGSTNAELAARLRNGECIPEGLWLVTDRQTAGKGRQGREWFDGAGNFMGSTVVRLAASDPPAPSLALLAGLALYETVAPLLVQPQALRLKWPNDLMLRDGKLAGVLLERVGGSVIVGIGVNLAVAPGLPDRATIALSAFGPAPDRDHFAQGLAANFDKELERWRVFGLSPLLRRWEAASYSRGTRMSASDAGEGRYSGTFVGLGEDGSLQLRLEDGAVRAIHAGDVTLV